MALRRALLLLSIALALVQGAPAQERAIPAEARRGYIEFDREVLVSIDGKTLRLAPGATIRDQRNLVIVPAAIPREGAWADYLLHRDGSIARVWLLRADEVARRRPAAQR